MSQLSSLDFFLDEQTRRRDQRRQESDSNRSGLDRLIDSRVNRRVQMNEVAAESDIRRLRRRDGAVGNELGGFTTGIQAGVAGVAAPIARHVFRSDEIADEIQGFAAAYPAAQQANVDQRIQQGKLGDMPVLGEVRKSLNRALPIVANSMTQAGVYGLTGGLGMAAGFSASQGDQSYYDRRQAGMTKKGATPGAAIDAGIEGGFMLAFQGLGKLMPAAAGMEGLLTNPESFKLFSNGIRKGLVDAGLRFGAEEIEEVSVFIGQAVNKAASMPGAEDSANWTGDDGTFWTSPVWDGIKDVTESTAWQMGMTEAVGALSQVDKKKLAEFGNSASRRTLAAVPDSIKNKLKSRFGNDRQAAAAALKELSSDDQAEIDAIANSIPSTESLATGQSGIGPINLTFQSRQEADDYIARNGEQIDNVSEQGDGVTQITLKPNPPPAVEPQPVPVAADVDSDIDAQVAELEAVIGRYRPETGDTGPIEDLEQVYETATPEEYLEALRTTAGRLGQPVDESTPTVPPAPAEGLVTGQLPPVPQPESGTPVLPDQTGPDVSTEQPIVDVPQAVPAPIEMMSIDNLEATLNWQRPLPEEELIYNEDELRGFRDVRESIAGAGDLSQIASILGRHLVDAVGNQVQRQNRIDREGPESSLNPSYSERLAMAAADEAFQAAETLGIPTEALSERIASWGRNKYGDDAEEMLGPLLGPARAARQNVGAPAESAPRLIDASPAQQSAETGSMPGGQQAQETSEGNPPSQEPIASQPQTAEPGILATDDGQQTGELRQAPDLSQYQSTTKAGTGLEVFGKISTYRYPEVLRTAAVPTLDLQKAPTGWLQKDTSNGRILIHPTDDYTIRFEAPNRKSGTEFQRAKAEAQAFAMDNPIETDESGVLPTGQEQQQANETGQQQEQSGVKRSKTEFPKTPDSPDAKDVPEAGFGNIEELPQYSVYPTTVQGKPMYAVRGTGRRGGGDGLFDTQAKAEQGAKDEQARDIANAEFRGKQQKKQDEYDQKEAARLAEYNDVDGFADDKPRLKQGAVRKVLNTQKRYQGKVLTSKELIRSKVADGWKVTEVNDKPAIEGPDGVFLNLNKTEAEYASHLIAKSNEADPAPVSPETVPGPSQADPAAVPAVQSEPSAERHDAVYRELQQLYKQPGFKSGDREIHQQVQELEKELEFHKPAAVARAQAEIDAEKQPTTNPVADAVPETDVGNRPQEPWQMTREEFSGTGPHDTNDYIRTRTGAKSPSQLLDYYQKKYPELSGVTIAGLESSDESGPLKNEGVARAILEGGKLVAKESQIHLTKDADLIVARHEIEHFLDIIHGRDPEKLEEFGRYNRHDDFNKSDYLHRSLVRDAVNEGKRVSPEVLADYPDLKPAAVARAQAEIDAEKQPDTTAVVEPQADLSETEQKEPDEFDLAMDAALDEAFGSDPGKAPPKRKPIGPRGQFALPGMESAAEEIENREAQFAAYEPMVKEVQDVSDEEFAGKFRAAIRQLYPQVARQVANNDYNGIESLVEDLTEEMTGKRIADVPDSVISAAEQMGKQAIESAPSINGFRRGDKVLWDDHDAGGEQYTLTNFVMDDDGDIQPDIRNKSGRMFQVSFEDIQLAPPKPRTLKEKAASRKKRTSAEYQDKLDVFKKAAGIDGSKLHSGIDPTILKAAVDLTKAAINDKISTFAEFIAQVVEDIGPQATQQFAEYFERSWSRLGTRSDFKHIDKAGKVSDIVGNSDDDTTSSTKTGKSDKPVDGRGSGRKGKGNRGGVGKGKTKGSRSDASTKDSESGDEGSGETDVRDGSGTDQSGDAADGSTTDSGKGVRVDSRRGISNDFEITDDDKIGVSFGKKTKFRQNVNAIKLLKALEAEGRQATPEEQAELVQYVGWGGLKEAFSTNEDQWPAEQQELKELLDAAEYGDARRSVRNAHYTSPEVIRAMLDGLVANEFKGGKILEPSVGVGHFFGLMPNSLMSESELHAVEMDSISARITRQLYPSANVIHSPYQEVSIPDGYYDLLISNVPFGPGPISDSFHPVLKKQKNTIHNFFFLKGLNNLRDGGVMAFVTSRYTMDGVAPGHLRLRQQITEGGGRFIGAVRLPNDAFKGIASTGVTTDVIFIQKNAGKNSKWQDVKEEQNFGIGSFRINEYYHDHPENLLGVHREGAGQNPGEFGLAPDGHDIGKELAAAIAAMPFDKKAMGRKSADESTGEVDERLVSERVPYSDKMHQKMKLEQGWTGIRNGKLFRLEGQHLVEKPIPYPRSKASTLKRIRGMDKIRRVRRQLMELEDAVDSNEKDIEALRVELNAVYDQYVDKNGWLNSVYNRASFKHDDDVFLLAGLELWDSDTKTATKTDIFTKRMGMPYSEPTSADTPRDAALLSLAQRGEVDIPYFAKLMGIPESEATERLEGLAYEDPDSGKWTMGFQYLSGNIREKLAKAEAAAEKDSRFNPNVDALKKILPQPKTQTDIKPRLNSQFVPVERLQEFAAHITGASPDSIQVDRIEANGRFAVTIGAVDEQKSTVDFGTESRSASDLFDRILNNAPLTVYYPQGRGERRIPNRTATAEAERKAKLIKDEFAKWIYSDPKRAASVVDSFNDTFNVYVEQESDGSHLLDPQTGAMIGSNQNIKLRPHQLASVWRHISDGNELLAHEVGLGKTFIMAAAAMEKKRLGLAKKQMVVVPNHLIEQFPREFKLMYPNAKILAPTSDQFNPSGRRQLLERIRNGDWDAIIVPMSSFKRIPMSPEYVTEKFGKHLGELEEAIRKARAASGNDNRNYVAELEAAKERLEGYLDKMLNESEKDAGPFFDEIGIDGLMVDEAHEFKNLWFMTSMTRVAGVQNQGNQTTFDMWMKTDYLNELTNEKGILFATGTPISNSVGEMYTMQRYLQPKLLEASGLKSFDAWANTFGEVVTDIEVTPTGDGFRSHSRFKRFTNVKALSAMFRQVADVKFAKDVGLDKGRPEMVGGSPQVIQIQPSLAMLDTVRRLSDRMEAIRAGNRDDNALSVTTDGRKAALDMRLIDELHEDSLFSKLNVAAERIKSIYDRTTDNKGVQIVWMDMGVPKSDKKKKPSNDEDEQSDSDDDQAEVSNIPLYQDLKDKLIASGIKESEIAFIHDAGNDNAKRQKLFYRVNQGDVRVIVANTKKMSTGANVQTRVVAMHHLDAPWKPADITQRDGRAIRQGNIYKDLGGVEIVRYITQGSFDAYIWQLLENKSGMINQIMMGDIDNTEDVGGAALSADEVKALASANPRVMDLVKLTSEQQTLELEQNAFNQQINSWRFDVSSSQDSIASAKKSLERSIQVVESLPSRDDIAFELTVDGTTYTKFGEAGKALLDRILENEPEHGQTIARIHGLDVRWERPTKAFDSQLSLSFDGYTLQAHEWQGKKFDLSDSDVGLATRIWNAVQHQFERPDIYRSWIKGYKQREQFATSNLKKNETWEKQEEYDDVTKRLDALRSEVGSSLREDRPITPLMKSARLAERLTKSTGRPIAGDARDPNNVVLVYGDGTKVDEKLIETERDQVDQETVRLLNKLEKPQVVTEDLFFNPKKYKSQAKSAEVKDSGVRRPASAEDDKGRQPPRDGTLGYSEKSGNGTRPTGRRGAVTTPEEQAGEDKGPISHTSVSGRLAKIWGATIKAGRVPGSMLASYQQSSRKELAPHVVRVIKSQMGDLGLLSHEIAHHIDQITDVLDALKNKSIWAELRNLDYLPGRADKKVARKEGFAEYVRMWMTAPDTGPMSAMMQAPQFTEYFEKWLKKNPEVGQKLTESRQHVRSYYNQSAEQRIASQIKESDTGDRPIDETALEFLSEKTRSWKDKFAADFINQYAPVKKLMKLMKDAGYKWAEDESSSYDLLMAFTNAAPQHAQRAVQYGIHTVSKTDKLLGRGLVTIVADSGVKEGKDYESAIRWIYARFAQELHRRKPKYNAGITIEDAEEILNSTSTADAARYKKLGDGLTEFNNNAIRMLVDAGVLSEEEGDAIISEGGEFFIPLIRVIDGKQAKSLGGGGLINMGKPIRGRSKKGSDAPIMDPILSTLNRLNRIYTSALNQQVVQQLATEIKGTEGAGSLMHRVSPDLKAQAIRVGDVLANKTVRAEMEMAGIDPDLYLDNEDLMTAMVNIFSADVSGKKDENVVRLMVDGKAELYWMNPELYESLDGMPDIMRHPFLKILGGFTRAVRLGAVGLNSMFAANNMAMDWRNFQERSRYTSGADTLLGPHYWFGKYVMHASGKGGKNEMAQLYEEFGGLLATRFGTGDKQSIDIRDIELKLSPEKKSSNLIHRASRKVGRFGHNVESFVAMADVGPRLAEFAGVLKTHGFEQQNGVIVDTNDGNKPKRPPRHVMVEAINAASEATVNFKVRGRKAQILNQMIPFFTASIASMNKQYRVLRGAYENDPTEANRMKVVMANATAAALTVLYMAMRGDDDDYQEEPNWLKYGYWTFTWDGKPLVRLPKGYEESFVPNAVEGVINSMKSGSREDFLDSIYQSMHKTMLPMEVAAIAGPFEVAMNYDTFRQQPIENQSLTGRSTVNRTNQWTSEFSKLLSTYGGQYIGLSPVEIDHLLSKQTGGMLPKVIGGVEGAVTGDMDKLWRAGQTLNPLSAFHVRKDYTDSINDVYEQQASLNEQFNDLRYQGKEPTPELQEERSKLSRVTGLLTEMRDLIEDERDRDERFKVEQYMAGLARWATSKTELERYPNPLKLRDMPENVRALVEAELMKVIAHSIIESKSKNETYVQSIESSREFLKASGISNGEALSLLSKHYRSLPLSRDRYTREQQIKDRRAKRSVLIRAMK
jgi:N12 class adenine-specific DNA methylase